MSHNDDRYARRAREERALREHNERMEHGCVRCGTSVPGRVCPDCYVCISCEPGCDECAIVRGPWEYP